MISPFAPQSTMLRRVPALAALGLAAASLAACAPSGTKELEGSGGDVQNAVAKFSKAASDGHSGVICRDLVTPELSKQLASHGKTCEEAVRNAITDADYKTVTIDTVKLPKGENGTTAIAVTKTSDRERFRAIELEKVDGKWLITGFQANAKQ